MRVGGAGDLALTKYTAAPCTNSKAQPKRPITSRLMPLKRPLRCSGRPAKHLQPTYAQQDCCDLAIILVVSPDDHEGRLADMFTHGSTSTPPFKPEALSISGPENSTLLKLPKCTEQAHSRRVDQTLALHPLVPRGLSKGSGFCRYVR